MKERLQKITSVGQTKAVLHKLSSCCEYGIKRKLIKENNFKDVWEYLPDTPLKNPYCFSDAEIKLILDRFADHSGSKIYYDLIVFLLNTGCIPSEALGVKWGDLDDDFTKITFTGSPQEISGKGIIWVEGSKNFKKGGSRGKVRSMPLGRGLKSMLERRAGEGTFDKDDLIFPNSKGGFINYDNFRKNAWRDCVRSLPGLDEVTPYNLRDTFITKQLMNGVPIAIVAAWCDNSPSMIESRYVDYIRLAMSSITPVDI